MALDRLLIYWHAMENECHASLPSFLLLAMFCLDQCQMEIAFSAQHL